jgi:hypothetical protein
MEEQITTVVVEQDAKTTIMTCYYGAAIIMRIYQDGDVKALDFKGETMDKICKAWQDYRAKQKGQMNEQ